jgi:DNA polymerase-1
MATALARFKLPKDYAITHPEAAKKERQKAKSICFGLIYGKGKRSLAKELGIDEDAAQEAITLWMRQFKEAADWLHSIEDFVQKYGYVDSPLGRRRRLPGVFSDDMGFANRCKRQARNTPVQSAASDTNFYAACRLIDAIEESKDKSLRKTQLVNTVHDSVVAYVHVDAVKTYCEIAKTIFTDRNLLLKDFKIEMLVPMAVDFDVGPNWGTMWDYNLTDKTLDAIMHDSEVAREYGPKVPKKELEKRGLLFAQKFGGRKGK